MFKPDKDNVLAKFAHRLGPQRSASHLLSHIGDQAVFKPFAPGDEPSALEVIAALLSYNEHISVDDVVNELTRHEYEAIHFRR